MSAQMHHLGWVELAYAVDASAGLSIKGELATAVNLGSLAARHGDKGDQN